MIGRAADAVSEEATTRIHCALCDTPFPPKRDEMFARIEGCEHPAIGICHRCLVTLIGATRGL